MKDKVIIIIIKGEKKGKGKKLGIIIIIECP